MAHIFWCALESQYKTIYSDFHILHGRGKVSKKYIPVLRIRLVKNAWIQSISLFFKVLFSISTKKLSFFPGHSEYWHKKKIILFNITFLYTFSSLKKMEVHKKW